MSFNPVLMVATVIGGLIVASLLGWIRKSRLIVLMPRSFSHSQLTERGQLVELSIFNRGLKTEESIELILSHMLKYELVGSNHQDARVLTNKVMIPRIGPSDEVTVLLMVEHGTFRKDDIVQCLSKETKGKVVSKLDEVGFTGSQRIFIVALVVVGVGLIYGFPYVIDYYHGSKRLYDSPYQYAPSSN